MSWLKTNEEEYINPKYIISIKMIDYDHLFDIVVTVFDGEETRDLILKGSYRTRKGALDYLDSVLEQICAL